MSPSSSPENRAGSDWSRGSEDWLTLSDDALLAQCRVERFRVSGPGGQHRNKTDSAVRLTHKPSEVVGYASERRSQHQNRLIALQRLRRSLALERRLTVSLEAYHPPIPLQRILPRAVRVDLPALDRIGPRHRDFWNGAALLLDLFEASNGSTADTASLIGCSGNQLVKLLASESHLWAAANDIRAERGLSPLRQ